MADEVDDAIFSVSAFDNFSDTLDDLEDNLRDIEATAQTVDPIDIDTHVADALADIEAVRAGIASLDDDKTIDIGVNKENIPGDIGDALAEDDRRRSIDAVDVNDFAGDILTDIESVGMSLTSDDIDNDNITSMEGEARDMLSDDINIDTEAQVADTLTELKQLALAANELDKEDVDIDVEADIAEAFADLQEVRAAARDDDLDIDAEAHVGSAITKINSVRAALASVDSHKTVNIDIDDDSSLFGPATKQWHDKQFFGDTTADPDEIWDMMDFHDNADFGVTPTGGTWLRDFDGGDNPLRGPAGDWDVELFGEDADLNVGARAGQGATIDAGRGDLTPEDERELIFGQRDIIDGDDVIPDEEVGGVAFPSRQERSPGERLREAFQDFKQLRLSMGMFMNLMASLLPLLGVFVGALPAAIAGVTALAGAALAAGAALYGIAGLGVMALAMEGGEWNFDALKEQTQGLIRTFMDAFGPLANAIEPMMLDLLDNVEMAMFGVAQHMHPLLSLTDDARRIFNTLLGMVGPFVEDTIRFANAMLPVFEMFGGILADINLFAMLGQILAETLPVLFAITSAIGNALPAIYDMSLGFLAVATSITWLFSTFLQLLDIVPFGIELFGYLTGIMLTLLSATALYSLATGQLMTRLAGLIVVAGKYIAAMITKIYVTYGAAAAVGTLAASFAVLLGILTLGIVPVVAGVSSQFSVLGNDIKDATGSLKAFNREAGRVNDISPGMDGPRYTRPSEASGMGSGTAGTSSGINNNYTVIAPDQETGNAVANTINFTNDDDDDDVNNRLHGV